MIYISTIKVYMQPLVLFLRTGILYAFDEMYLKEVNREYS